MTTTTPTRRVGDKVSVDHPKYPGVWTIKSQGPVNSTLEPVNGGRSLRCPHTMLTDPATATATATVTAVPIPVLYNPGELVRVPSGKWAGLYVVIADRGGDRVNLTKLGGDQGRYLRIDKRGLVRVDPAEVLK